MDMKNPARDEPMHNKVLSNVLEDTNQGTPAQGDYCSFPLFGNDGASLMDTLNIPVLNVGLSICLWTTMNVTNYLDSY
jgi:hypothetical protein